MIFSKVVLLTRPIFWFAASCCLAACGATSTLENTQQVNKGSLNDKQPKAMVVTANPHASKAGIEILKRGGSAVDAAIAIEAVLSLVEPQSSGLGGGGFLTYYDGATKQVSVYDGRETAPASIKPKQFLNEEGKSIGFIKAKTSGLSTGVPGMVAMLKLAHDDHGALPWGQHFSAAEKLAIEGFEISPRLFYFINRFGRFIPKTLEEGTLDAANYFFDEAGNAKQVGDLLKNPAYAKTLQLISIDAANFYKGEIAAEIVRQVSQSPRPGSLALSDLESYQARKHQALCADIKGLNVCGAPPPSSWVAVAMILGLLENAQEFSAAGAQDGQNWALFAEAQRLAYADRDRYIADDSMVDVPLQGLMNKSYLADRAKLISPEQAIDSIAAGDPWAYQGQSSKTSGLDATVDKAGTTHFVVVDQQGNVVSMTASVESIFGSTRMAGGMFLNNQLTDFSFQPVDENGSAIANAVAPGKRPRSSMSPTIVLDEKGNFKMASGSPGGNSIIAYTAKTLVGVLEWGLSPQQAIELPNMVARGDKVRIEKDRASPELIQSLRDYGYEVKESAGENSGLSVVSVDSQGKLVGGVDPRREGTIEVIY